MIARPGLRSAEAIVAGAALLLFAIMAALVHAGMTTMFDLRVLEALRKAGAPSVATAPAWLVRGAIAVTELGTGIVRAPVAIAGALLLFARNRKRAAAALAIAVAGGALLLGLIKEVAGRARPELPYRMVAVGQTSFPSGHAMGSMILYPLLGVLVGGLIGRRAAWIGGVAGVVLAILVGLTRVLLGVHWASDVVAGWLLGIALAAVALALSGARPAPR